MSDKSSKPQQIKIEFDESSTSVEYCNLAIVTHSPAEFIIDYIRILPGTKTAKVKSSAYLDRDLGYDEEHCYTISAIDAEGDASGFSQIICGKTNTPPDLQIKNYKLIENSSNNSLDARESGKLRFALLNNGNSPSKNIRLSIRPSIDNDVNENELSIYQVGQNPGDFAFWEKMD